jgi:hypothetical protein
MENQHAAPLWHTSKVVARYIIPFLSESGYYLSNKKDIRTCIASTVCPSNDKAFSVRQA